MYNNMDLAKQFIDAAYRAGVRVLEINLDAEYLSAASEYSPGPGYEIISDCAANVRFAYGEQPPAGTGAKLTNWACGSLYNYDLMFGYAVSTYGMKLHLRVKPDTAVTACGWTAATTEAQFIACYSPLVVAAARRWQPITDSVTLIHEAACGFSTHIPFQFTIDWIKDYITSASNGIRKFSSTMHLGACSCTPVMADSDYMAMYVTHPGLDYVCADLYMRGCDVSTYSKGVLNTVDGWVTSARNNGKMIRQEEAGAPPHVPATCTSPDDTQAYEGSGWTGYGDPGGLHDVWLQAITAMTAAWGMTGMTVYCDEWLMLTTADPANASCVGFGKLGPPNYPAGTLPWLASDWSPSPGSQGVTYTILGGWPAGGPSSIQGSARLTGRSSLKSK
jgi:hypothetical protein